MNHGRTSSRPCPVCDSLLGKALVRLDYALFDDLSISGTKTLVCCEECAMLYDDITLTEEQLGEYYRRNEHYAASSVGGNGGSCADNIERYDRIIDSLKPATDDLILDFGCGQGGFVTRCMERGLRAIGIDPSERNREVARQAGLSVYESVDAFLAAERHPRIRWIVLSHVLEHLLQPMALLRQLSQAAEESFVYIEVPDADGYLSPESVRWQELYFEHLSHFRSHSLSDLAGRAGIEISGEYTVPFSRELSKTRCLVLMGRLTGNARRRPMARSQPYAALPSVSIKDLIQDDRPLVLWGLSQYAMLLLGSCPELTERLSHLIDASPAKIGRTIRGIRVKSPDHLSALPRDANLLIPASPYLPQMLNQLLHSGFDGTVRVI